MRNTLLAREPYASIGMPHLNHSLIFSAILKR